MDHTKHYDKKPSCGQDSNLLTGGGKPGGNAGYGKPSVAGTDKQAPESGKSPAGTSWKSSAHDD